MKKLENTLPIAVLLAVLLIIFAHLLRDKVPPPNNQQAKEEFNVTVGDEKHFSDELTDEDKKRNSFAVERISHFAEEFTKKADKKTFKINTHDEDDHNCQITASFDGTAINMKIFKIIGTDIKITYIEDSRPWGIMRKEGNEPDSTANIFLIEDANICDDKGDCSRTGDLTMVGEDPNKIPINLPDLNIAYAYALKEIIGPGHTEENWTFSAEYDKSMVLACFYANDPSCAH